MLKKRIKEAPAASTQDLMPDDNLLLELHMKPKEPGRALREAEVNLLRAFIGAILQDVAAEEKRLEMESTSKNNPLSK